MKVNIQKFQTGGGFKSFTPIIHTAPTRSAKSDTTTTQKNSPSSMLDEKTYELLMSKGGLSNDVNDLVEQIISLEASTPNFGAYSQSTNSAMALRISAKVRELMNTKENWIDAGKAAKDAGGLNEVAVDGYNQLYTKSANGELKTITTTDYLKQGKPLRLLTVAEVLNERNSNPNLVGRNDLLDVANNAIGVDKILNQVKDLIGAIGKESTSETDVYSQKELSNMLASLTDSKRKPTPDELKSLSKLQSALNTRSPYYEIKNSEDSEKKYLDKAFNYIWGTLDRGKQQKLAAVAAVNGESNPKLFIWDMLNNGTDVAKTLDITPMAKIAGESTTDSNRPKTTFELQNNGESGQEIVRWNDPTTGLVMNLAGNNVSLWDNAGNNTMIKMGPLGNLLESHTGALLKRSDVFFGDKKVGVGDYDNIIIDPNAGSARVYFPVKSDGSPDYDLMNTINGIRETAPKNLTPDQLTAYFAEKGYSFVKFDKNFLLKPNKDIKPFLLTYGYADEKSNSIDDNKQIRELSGIQEKETEDMMTRLHTKMKIKEPTGFFNWSNSYYKGNILIPYLDDSSIVAASLVGNITAPKTSLEDARVHQNVEKARIINASSSIFNTK